MQIKIYALFFHPCYHCMAVLLMADLLSTFAAQGGLEGTGIPLLAVKTFASTSVPLTARHIERPFSMEVPLSARPFSRLKSTRSEFDLVTLRSRILQGESPSRCRLLRWASDGVIREDTLLPKSGQMASLRSESASVPSDGGVSLRPSSESELSRKVLLGLRSSFAHFHAQTLQKGSADEVDSQTLTKTAGSDQILESSDLLALIKSHAHQVWYVYPLLRSIVAKGVPRTFFHDILSDSAVDESTVFKIIQWTDQVREVAGFFCPSKDKSPAKETTLLHLAVSRDFLHVTRQLLLGGSDPNAQDVGLPSHDCCPFSCCCLHLCVVSIHVVSVGLEIGVGLLYAEIHSCPYMDAGSRQDSIALGCASRVASLRIGSPLSSADLLAAAGRFGDDCVGRGCEPRPHLHLRNAGESGIFEAGQVLQSHSKQLLRGL